MRYFHVVDYGADPTGERDSTAAIQAAIDAAQRHTEWEMVAWRSTQTRTRRLLTWMRLLPPIPKPRTGIFIDPGNHRVSSTIRMGEGLSNSVIQGVRRER